MVMFESFQKAIVTILTTFIFLDQYNCVSYEYKHSVRPLVCLCNDNHHCITKKLAFENSNVSISSGLSSISIGWCETSKSGRCYTVKEINLDAIKPYVSKRKRKSLPNESGVSVTVSNSQENGKLNILTNESSNVTADMFIRIRFGCLPSDERTTLSCNSHISNHVLPRAISCCNSSDFCNGDNVPKFYHYQDDLDAINTALHNINNRRPENKQKRPVYLNPNLNTGPELLIGGNPMNKTVFEAHSEPYSAHDSFPFTRVVFLVSFAVVIAILIVTLLLVFIVYKRGVQKRRQIVYNSVHWVPSHLKNKKNTRLFRRCGLSMNNEGKLMPTDLSSQKEKTYLEHVSQNGPNSHTNSTDSTRTNNYYDEKQVLLPSLYPDLVYQTVSKQVTLLRLLGRGRMSEVWSGRWLGEPVTAKLFPAHNRLAESVWRRAVLLHRSMLLRHQSVQGLMAIDSISWPHQVPPAAHRVMLIAEWLQFGSLSDVMANYRWTASSAMDTSSGHQRSSTDSNHFQLIRAANGNGAGEKALLTATDTDSLLAILLRMAHSLTQGLCFLHTEFAGTRGKPALAHRDLKPANVLIRSDWTCCLTDLGLAVRPLPSNLPVSQGDLHSLYRRYVNQLAFPVDHQADTAAPAISATEPINNRGPDVFEENKCDSDNPTLMGVGSEEVEQLAWWPIGGTQVGTPRYLAPELLANSIDPFCFTSYQKADIYALGLILWELFTWTLSCCHHQHRDNHPTASIAMSGDAVASHNAEPMCTAVVDCSTTGRTSLTSACPSPVQDCPGYSPAFQEEVEYYFSTGYDHKHVCELPKPELQDDRSSKISSSEPDIPTMHHLVCSLRLRPKLPQPFALLTCTCRHLCSEHSTRETEKYLDIEVASEGDSGRLQSSARSSTDVTDSCPCCNTVNGWDQKVAGPSASYSSSSGASSLNDPSPCSAGSSDTTRPPGPVCSGLRRFTRATGQLVALLPECWSQNPDARLTALRVRKNLQRVADQLLPGDQQVRSPLPSVSTPGVVLLLQQSPNANLQQCGSGSSSATIKGV